MALEVLAAVLGIRGPYRAGRGGSALSCLNRSWFPFNACLQDLPIRRLVRTGRWASARPEVSPVADMAVVSVPGDR